MGALGWQPTVWDLAAPGPLIAPRRESVMKVLIGYSMRSGSTLLQHILNGHDAVTAYSDLSSLVALVRSLAGFDPGGTVCIKPMDLLFLQRQLDLFRHFDRFLWLARDPRDSYLSTVESRYGYLFWRPGRREAGIDIGLLERWKRVYRWYFEHPERWHLLRYEDLVTAPETTLRGLLAHLGLPHQPLFPFPRHNILSGGDTKITRHSHVTARSRARHERELDEAQQRVFERHLGGELRALGYRFPWDEAAAAPAIRSRAA